ncbi:MAG: hypothetical protein Tsb002_00920 [Wenzhouxiangellaceae bacterium]
MQQRISNNPAAVKLHSDADHMDRLPAVALVTTQSYNNIAAERRDNLTAAATSTK